jgi:hypothetical protein
MAKVIKRTERHNCREEIAQLEGHERPLWLGSIVECSCGMQYVKREDQRDGEYWAEVRNG